MRPALMVVAMVVLAVIALAVRRPEPETVAVSDLPSVMTGTTSRWGPALEAEQPLPDGSAEVSTRGTVDPATVAAGTVSTTAATAGEVETPGGSSIPAEAPGVERTESDADPGGVAAGDLVISSNATEPYPLEAMVEPAVRLLRAELTGEGRDGYPHLADQVEGPCCTDLVVNGAVVLFGETASDPARIMLDWEANEVGGDATRRAVTETRWWWVEGTWIGEHER